MEMGFPAARFPKYHPLHLTERRHEIRRQKIDLIFWPGWFGPISRQVSSIIPQ